MAPHVVVTFLFGMFLLKKIFRKGLNYEVNFDVKFRKVVDEESLIKDKSLLKIKSFLGGNIFFSS